MEKIKAMNPKSTLIKSIQNIAGIEGVSLLAISPESPDFMVVEIYFDPETVTDRLTPDEVALKNYNAQIINNTTCVLEFTDQIQESTKQLLDSYYADTFDASKLADISLWCDNMSIHYAIDLQAEKEAKMLVNESKKD